MAQAPWEMNWNAPQGSPAPQGGPVLGPPADPYKQSDEARKQAAERRAQEDQTLQRQKFELDQQKAQRDAKKDTMGSVEQGKSASFLKRAVQANTDYSKLGNIGPRSLIGQAAADAFPNATNYVSSPERQQAEQAERAFIAAVLRYDSGAAIPPQEFVTQGQIYFPRPGDSPEVIAQKAQQRKVAIEGLKAAAGPAGLDTEIPDFGALGAPAGETGGNGVRRVVDPETGEIWNEEDVVGSIDGNDPGYMQFAAGVGDIVQAVGDTAGIVVNPINTAIFRGLGYDNYTSDFGQTLRDLSGLPQGDPTISMINRGAAGGLMFGGGAATLGARALPGVARNALLQVGASPVGDAIVGGTAAGSGEAVKAAGGNEAMQAGATLLGGLAGAGAVSRFGRQPRPVPPGGAPPVDPRSVVRDGAREKVRVFTSDVAPPTTIPGQMARLTGESIPIAGTGGGLGGRATQQAERVEATKRFVRELGGTPGTLDDITADFVATRGNKLQKLVGAKDSVIDTVQAPVTAPKAVAEIDRQIARLNSANEEAFAPVVAKLQNFRQVLSSGKTLRDIETNRSLLGDLFDDTGLAAIKGPGQKAINKIYDPLRQDMGDAIEANLGKNARLKWQKANDQLAAMAGELDDNKFRTTLNKADVTPEKVSSLLFSKTPSELRRLYGSLSETGKNKARSAIIHEAAKKAIDGDYVNPNAFRTGLKALDEATGIFFSPADKARIDGFERLLQATQRGQTATTEVMTGARNTGFFALTSLGQAFSSWALPAGAMAGVLARIYESGPARDLILKLGKTKPGSPAEAAVGKRLSDYLTRAGILQNPANDMGEAVNRSTTAAYAEDQEQK